ncbi:MAG: Flp pilus assembly protein CpaB, partial [Armatimonadetes bacterium]|nr:Flp pilus assembly protein CpaB [Armatimonadota bacterium]
MMPPARTQPKGANRAQTLALAAGAGLAAALLAYVALARQMLGDSPQARPVPVVVAARDLPARRLLTAGMLRVRPLPASEVPAGSVGTLGALAGQVTTAAVAAGQPVTRGMVTARSASPGLAWAVVPAHRALNVALDPAGGTAGFLEPGDHVDVLATFEPGDGRVVTRTILQNARLLAIGSRTAPTPPGGGGDDKPAASATLEVTPREAQALALASARGKVQLALRGL